MKTSGPSSGVENNQGSSQKHKDKTKECSYKVLKDDLNQVCSKDSSIMMFFFFYSLFSTSNLNGRLTKYMPVFCL